jgi:hypothetical protein
MVPKKAEPAFHERVAGRRKLEAVESRKMKPIGIFGLLALSACAHLGGPTASYPIIPQETSSDNVDDEFAGRSAHPATLTAVEAQKAAKARFDSPLDPDKPATQEAKQISLTPPAGKVDTGND